MAPVKIQPEEMELFRTEDYFVLLNSESSLWCSRRTGEMEAKPCWELANCGDLECLGVFYGYVGKINLHNESSRLVLIKETVPVGQLPDSRVVFRIKSVTFVDPCSSSESPAPSVDLKSCKKHRQGSFNFNFEVTQKAPFSKTWGQIKSATSSIKNTTQHAAALATYQVKSVRRESKERDRFEKRIIEELNRAFTDPESFYFCPKGDLTGSLQRSAEPPHQQSPVFDDRFFWNHHMLQDIIEINTDLSKSWVLPVIQGFVQIEECKLEFDLSPNGTNRFDKVSVALVSRRSCHRAGTRYKRRGLDEAGWCANYVETEQIVASGRHAVAFVQVRGSIPLFWSQPGFKYRPPPVIDKGDAETRIAFEKHMAMEESIYGSICIVNLIEQTGREKILWDAFTQQVMRYNNEHVTYATFDFHEHCRGLRFENVSLLVNRLEEVIHEMGFFWRDKEGVIYRQSGVFRVNCMDCLDRTNVVQTAIAKVVMEVQLVKLGLLPPEQGMPSSLKTTFQLMWANNGDAISKQYAGTAALKGDYTRTGERKITGLVKDGMNSANRYYLSRFKDAYRQATIDIMQGECVNPDMNPEDDSDADMTATAEHVKLLLEDCKKMLIPDSSLILGAWGLINADPVTGDPTETDVDTILILTRDSYYVADYDDELDQVIKLQQISLDDITVVEMGPMPVHIHSPMQLFHKAKSRPNTYYCLRIRYRQCERLGAHTFRSSSLRFFNNVAVVIKSEDEVIESVRAIYDSVHVAVETAGHVECVEWVIDQPLSIRPGAQSQSPASLGGVLNPISRNVSENQLASLKSVGSKALSNMTSTFTKIGNTLTPGRKSSVSKESAIKPILRFFSSYRCKLKLGSLTRYCEVIYYEVVRSISNKKEKKLEKNRRTSGKSKKASRQEFIMGGEGHDSDDDVVCSPTRDTFLPDVGIVMNRGVDPPSITVTDTPQRRVPKTLGVLSQNTPLQPPGGKVRTLSRSSEEVVLDECDRLGIKADNTLLGKSSSERDLTLPGMAGSQSENALRSLKSAAKDVLTSPSAVLSPLGKLARGVQSLGQNLDPRRLKSGNRNSPTISAETQRLEQAWDTAHCKSRLIAV